MKKLAIVGTHTRTRDQAPWFDPDYEIWVFNESPQKPWVKRWDACFQLHRREVYSSPNNFVDKTHWDWLQQPHGKTIWMQAYDEDVPDCKAYPLDPILTDIPGASLKWFKSSFAYALALAYWLGYREVDIYGTDMESSTEYGYQLPNFQFWIGVGLGLGVHFGCISNEQYFGGSMYAYDGEIQISREYFSERIETLSHFAKSAGWEVKKANDRLTDALMAGKKAETGECVGKLQEAVIASAQYQGAAEAAKYYASRTDPIPRQEFERKAAEAQRDSAAAMREMDKAAGEGQYVWNAWNQTGSIQARDQLKTFVNKQMMRAEEHGRLAGLYRENFEYMTKLDSLIEAAGGQHTLEALGAKA